MKADRGRGLFFFHLDPLTVHRLVVSHRDLGAAASLVNRSWTQIPEEVLETKR